jgi:hypothetical protein
MTSAILCLKIRVFMTVPPLSLHRKDKVETGGHQGQTKVLRQLCAPETIGEENARRSSRSQRSSHAEHEVLSETLGLKVFGGGG